MVGSATTTDEFSFFLVSGRRQLLATGAIPPLVTLLKRGPKEAATAALGTLREMTTLKGSLDAIIQCQGIEVSLTQTAPATPSSCAKHSSSADIFLCRGIPETRHGPGPRSG